MSTEQVGPGEVGKKGGIGEEGKKGGGWGRREGLGLGEERRRGEEVGEEVRGTLITCFFPYHDPGSSHGE